MSGPTLDLNNISQALRVTECPFEVQHLGQAWKCIGQGFQYTAYGTTDRVLKIPLETDQVCAKFRASWGFEPDRAQVARDRETGLAVIRATREQLDAGKLPSALLADACISEQLWIEQSRVLPLREAFESATDDARNSLVDRYIQCAKKLITYGAHETGFALLDNFGLNNKADVVLLDFGELTFERGVALKSILEKAWTKDRGGIKLLSGEPLRYYLETMGSSLTPSFVESEWTKAT